MKKAKHLSYRSRIVGAGVAVGSAAVMVASVAAGAVFAGEGSANAVPAPQVACASENMTITPPAGGGAGAYVPVGPALTVHTKSPTDIVAFLSIDGNVSSATSAEMRASWSVNGAAAKDFKYGPGNIHEGDGPFEGSSTVVDVIPVGRGTQTIQPEVRMNGAAGTSGVVGDSCALIEAHTS